MEQTRYKDYKYNIHNTFKNSLFETSSTPCYMHVIWNQIQHPTICYGVTYYKQNGELSLMMNKQNDFIIYY